jgi:hypothetical protein
MRCVLNGQALDSFVVEKQQDGLSIAFEYQGDMFSYASSDQMSMRLFIQDLSACFSTIAELDNRLALDVRQDLFNRIYANAVDTPIALKYNSVDLLLFFKPNSFDNLPITFQASILGSDWITIRTDQASVRLFSQQLTCLLNDWT